MTFDTRNRRFSRLASLTIAAIGLAALTLPLSPANAQFIGLDFGNGVGIGLGTPPSAYGYYRYGYPAYYYDRYDHLHYYRPYYYAW